MEFEFKLPDLGEGIAEAEIRGWLVEEGEQIEEHQPVVEVETDKAVVELPSPRAGKVIKYHHLEGEIVNVGEVLLTIEHDDEDRRPSYGIVGELPEATESSTEEESNTPAPAEEISALPSVRELARELNVDLSAISGTGPDQSISAEDVRAAVGAGRTETAKKATETPRSSAKRLAQKGLRRVIAQKLLQAQQLTAFVTNMEEFDVTRLWELKRREEPHLAERDLPLTFLPFS